MGLKIEVIATGFSGLRTLMEQLGDGRVMKAARRGLMEHVRLQERQAVRLVSAQTRVPASRVQPISSVRSSGGGLQGEVRFEDKPLSLGEHTSRSWSRSARGATAGDWRTYTYPRTFMIGGSIFVRRKGDPTTREGRRKFRALAKMWGPVLPNELLRKTQPAFQAANRLADQDLEKRVLRHIVRLF